MSCVRMRQIGLRAVKWASAATDPVLGRRPGPRILIYHQVGATSNLEMDVERSRFEKQLDWMQEHGDIVSLEEALSALAVPIAGYQFVLTFDDGHQSVYTDAFPQMAARGLPFTLYLTTAPLEAGAPLHGDPRQPLLSWPEIGEMFETGLMTVGAHSHRHLDARRHDRKSLSDDLETCDVILEDRVGVRPRHYAYPWGHWSAVADAVVRARYESAAVGAASMRLPADPYRLSRIPVMGSDTGALFRRKMWGGFRFETQIRTLRDRIV